MAASTHPAPIAPPGESIEVLKRIRATETEWDQKIAAARRESAEALARLREETVASLKAALSAAEAERVRALERARLGVEREVATILSDGERATLAAARSEGKRPRDLRDRVLAAVLGPFATD